MNKIKFIIIWLLGFIVLNITCSNNIENNNTMSTGATTNLVTLVTENSGGSSSINTLEIGGMTNTNIGGNSLSGNGGMQTILSTSVNGGINNNGGSIAGKSSIDEIAGSGTSNPPPGETVDPPPGETIDPPPGETVDPPPGETIDPPPSETIDPPPGETVDPPPGETIDPPPGETIDPPNECIPIEMENINVIVFKDAEPSGADSEGRMYIGGDAILAGYAVGSQEDVDCTRWDLVVGGDLTVSGGSVSNGKVAYGGEYTPLAAFTAACGVWNETPIDFDLLRTKMITYSEVMSNYSTNAEAIVNNDTLILTGIDEELNIFSITAEQLNNNITLNVPDNSSVIINVSGTDIIWSGKGFSLPDGGKACRGDTSDWCHSIMFNMYEAINLEVSGIGVQGSILAPYSTFIGNGGNVDGQVIVEYLYSGIEFHPYFFTGCLLLPETL